MNIGKVDKWLKDQYGISYTEMSNEFNGASELLSKKYKEVERLNNIISEIKEYFEDLEIFAPSMDIKYDILDIIEGSDKE